MLNEWSSLSWKLEPLSSFQLSATHVAPVWVCFAGSAAVVGSSCELSAQVSGLWGRKRMCVCVCVR